MSDKRQIRVVKVGGSLLDKPGIADVLREWISHQVEAHNVLIVGGGMVVETIRRYSQIHETTDCDAHDFCLEAMSLTARMFAAYWPGDLPIYGSLHECRVEHATPGACLMNVQALFSDSSDLPRISVPSDWSVTSDSLAAYVASALDATELVLLKSAAPPQPLSAESAANLGYVDRHFPSLAGQLRAIRIVNCRDDGWPTWTLRHTASSPKSHPAWVSGPGPP